MGQKFQRRNITVWLVYRQTRGHKAMSGPTERQASESPRPVLCWRSSPLVWSRSCTLGGRKAWRIRIEHCTVMPSVRRERVACTKVVVHINRLTRHFMTRLLYTTPKIQSLVWIEVRAPNAISLGGGQAASVICQISIVSSQALRQCVSLMTTASSRTAAIAMHTGGYKRRWNVQ